MPTRVRIKRIRILLASCLFLLLAIILTRRLYLSDQFLLQQFADYLESVSGLKLTVEKSSINLLRGWSLHEVSLNDPDSSFVCLVPRLDVQYKLLPLWQRRVVFTAIILQGPIISLHRRPESDALPHEPGAPAPDSLSKAVPASFPFIVEAANIQIHDATFQVSLKDTVESLSLRIKGINLEAKQVRFHGPQDFHGELQVTANGSLQFQREDQRLKLVAAALLQLQGEGLVGDSSRLQWSLKLDPTVSFSAPDAPSNPVHLPTISAGARTIITPIRDLLIDDFNLDLDGVLHLAADASLTTPNGSPRVQVHLADGEGNLESAANLVRQLWPPGYDNPPWLRWKLTGRLKFSDSEISGSLSAPQRSLHATLRGQLLDGILEDPRSEVAITGMQINAFADCRILPKDSLFVDSGIDLSANRLFLGRLGGDELTLENVALGISATVSRHWMSPQLQLVWNADGPYKARQEGSFVLRADSLRLADPLASPRLYLEGGGSLQNLPLEAVTANQLAGKVALAVDAQAVSLSDINLKIGVYTDELTCLGLAPDLILPPEMMRLTAHGAIAQDLQKFSWDSAHLSLPPFIDLQCRGHLSSRPDWQIDSLLLQLNAESLLSVLRPLLPPAVQQMAIAGNLTYSGSLQGSAGGGEFALDQQTAISGPNLSLSLPSLNLQADSVNLDGTLSGAFPQLSVSGDAQIGRLSLPQIRSKSYEDLSVAFQSQIENFRQIRDFALQAQAPNVGLSAQAAGQLACEDRSWSGKLQAALNFASRDTLNLIENLKLCGQARADFALNSLTDSSLILSGRTNADSLVILYGDALEASGVTFAFPWKETLNFHGADINLAPQLAPNDRLADPVLAAFTEHQQACDSTLGYGRADHLRVGSYEAANISAELRLASGSLSVPYLAFSAYEGRMAGSGSLHAASFNADSIRYQFQAAAQGINSSRLPGVKTKSSGAGTELAAFAHFRGQGVNWQRDFKLDGRLDFTQIGRGVADNVLRFLDPGETDPSVQAYRGYIKRGWGVKVLSFKVRDGFVYTAIQPAKPPLTKPDMFIASRLVGLGSTVNFARTPLRYFLTPSRTAAP